MTNLQLRIALDPESVKQVQALAVYPEVRGDHVTLSHVPISQPINPAWFPQEYHLGDRVALQAVGMAQDDRIQALVVEIGGSTVRPWDQGMLHVTVSKRLGVDSVDSNLLLQSGPYHPLQLNLQGQIQIHCPEVPLLETAIALAVQAHAGQVDKAGKPYISHPIRVVNGVTTLEEKIVAVLHDAIEDSDLTLEELKQAGLPSEALEAIAAITKREGEDYEVYLERVMSNQIALKVKIADMKDNLNISRIAQPTERDYARMEKYRQILPRLQAALKTNEGVQDE